MKRTVLLATLLSMLALGGRVLGQPHRGTRWGVLIGVNDYTTLDDLKYCSRDMQGLKDQLVGAGFESDQVFLVHDGADDKKFLPFKSNIEQQLNMVLGFAERDDLLVVAFSGHGMYFDGRTYLCPTDADPDRPETLVPLDELYGKLKSCRANLRLLIVDACRNDPRPAGRKSATAKQDLQKLGEAFTKPPEGIVLLSSCAPGEISYESKDFGRGVFMNYLLEAVGGQADENGDGKVSITEAAQYAGRKTKVHVAREFFSSQRPFLTGDLSTDVLAYSLVPRVGPRPIPKAETEFTNTIGMRFKLIPAGEFLMGSSKSPQEIVRLFDLDADNAKYYTDEHPQHRVQITKPYYLGVTEVTQGQWEAVIGTQPWSGMTLVKEGQSYPATYVSWEDAVEFCKRLSQKEGKTYRLPTEAEWEYACRAGTTTMYSFADDASRLADYGWFDENAYDVDEKYAHQVGQKKPNGFGLYDMHGNVYEWCSDWYGEDYYEGSPSSDPTGPTSGSHRVPRGGSWGFYPGYCRSAARGGVTADFRSRYLGFRVALVPAE